MHVSTTWLCSEGSYSDYHVTAIYTKREDAEAVSKAYGWNDPQEMEIDPVVPQQAREGLTHFSVYIYADPSQSPHALATDLAQGRDTYMDEHFFVTYCWAKGAEHAIKIAADRKAQMQVTGVTK
jgi:hypothetical protein